MAVHLLMESFVNGLNKFFDWPWSLLSTTPAYFDLITISAISGLMFMIVFKKTSNQEMIAYYKNKIAGHILEIRLYKDHPGLIFRSICSVLWYNLIYIRYTLVPLVIIIIPFLILTIQINNRYGYLPINCNHPFLIRVDLDKKMLTNPKEVLEKVSCETSAGITLDTQPLRIASRATAFWRATCKPAGSAAGNLKMVYGEWRIDKQVITDLTQTAFSPGKTKWEGLISFFENNAEGFIPKQSPIKAVFVSYQRARFPFLFWKLDPIILFFVLTIIFGFVFKPLLRVRI